MVVLDSFRLYDTMMTCRDAMVAGMVIQWLLEWGYNGCWWCDAIVENVAWTLNSWLPLICCGCEFYAISMQ